mgnify:CR=1 FL=1
MKLQFITAALVAGAISAGPILAPATQETDFAIIIDQGLGMGLDKKDGSFYEMDKLVAQRGTGLFVKAAPKWEDAVADSTMTITGNGQEWIFPAKDYDEEWELIDYTDSGQNQWQPGEYLITVKLGDLECEREVCFRDMKNIRILAVPVTACYSGEIETLNQLDDSLDDFTRKVYPLGSEDLEWNLYEGENKTRTLNGGGADLDTVRGRYGIWRTLSGMKKDDYDLVIGFVPRNMRPGGESAQRTVTGFTFGKGTVVISLEDTSPEVTVAHEIGHCYNLGDEYANGTFCLAYNMVPYGMEGKDAQNPLKTVSGDCPYIKGGLGNAKQGTGTVISKEQYAYDSMTNELIDREMTSLMGLSGYSADEYWCTTDTWNTMYSALSQ